MIEFTRQNLVATDVQIDDEQAKWISVYLETWFDVDEKFGIHQRDNDNCWVNLYAEYNPWDDELEIHYIVCYDGKEDEDHFYLPTDNERKLVIELIEELVQRERGCSCLEWSKKWNKEEE